MTTGYDVLLFDLGGVIIELGPPPVVGADAAEAVDEEVWRRWLLSPAVRRFETGRSTPAQFGAAMVEEFGLDAEPDEFLAAFRDWPRGLFPGTKRLLRHLGGRFTLACLSNSNPLHWRRFHQELGLADLFDHRFASHLIGSLKPDREVFDHVVGELGRPRSRVLFFDDNQMCVDGARLAGLTAVRVRGPAGVAGALVELGLLSLEEVSRLGLE